MENFVALVDSLERIGDQLDRIGDRLEEIETRLRSRIVVEVDLDRYCLKGDPYVRVYGNLNVDQRSV